MNLHNPEDFRRAWESLDDPKEIREAAEQDQEAEDQKDIAEYPFRVIGGKQVRIGDE